MGSPRKLPTRCRQRLVERDGEICWSCGRDLLGKYWEIGHIVDRYLGGSDDLENLAPMCVPCNHGLKPDFPSRVAADLWRANGGGARAQIERCISWVLDTMLVGDPPGVHVVKASMEILLYLIQIKLWDAGDRERMEQLFGQLNAWRAAEQKAFADLEEVKNAPQ